MKKCLVLAIFLVGFCVGAPLEASTLATQLRGRIVLQVESRGEAWYVDPVSSTRFYLGRPEDAFAVMRSLGLGITNNDLAKIPIVGDARTLDRALTQRLLGRIVLQVESRGEAWYISPVDSKRYSLGTPANAFAVMRSLGLGITNTNLALILVATSSITPPNSSPPISPPNPTPTPTPTPTPVPSPGKTYYVAPTGNDASAGTLAQPWRTPGYASRQLKPGDTLIIRGGRYSLSVYNDDIITPSSGTASAWITIQGETGNRPVLVGSNNLIAMIELSNASYIKIANLELTNNNGGRIRDGIEAIDGPTNNIIFQDLYIHHVDEFGINIGDTNNIQIVNSVVSYCGFGAIGGPDGRAGGWRNAKIVGSTMSYSGRYYQGRMTTSPFDRPDGFGVEESLGPIEFANDLIEYNLGDGLDSKVRNTNVHETTIANNSSDSLKLWGGDSRATNVLIYGRGAGNMSGTPWAPIVINTTDANSTFTFTNITVDDVVGQNYIMAVQYDEPTVPVTVVMRNSIINSRGQNAPFYFSTASRFTFTNNLFNFPATDTFVDTGARYYDQSSINAFGTGNKYGDPLFVMPAAGAVGNYTLRSGSPAIDAGTATNAPAIDITGALRPIGNGYDIGVYEQRLVSP